MRPPENGVPPLQVEAFGIALVLHDDLDVPGLLPASHPSGAVSTAVWHDPLGIRERWAGAHPIRTREMRDAAQLLLSVDHDPDRGYLLDAPGIGTALVSGDGLEVRCAPDPGTPDWKVLLVGQVLPLAATVRGYEVFHAAGVVIADRSYMLCAAPGTGKTSLAAHLVMGGAELLSDDVVALDDSLIAHPGAAVLHVREPELERLGPDPLPGLCRLGTVRGRVTFAVDHPAHARPLRAIYLLERSATGATIEPLPHASPFSLLGATFNLSVRSSVRLVHHLELCARLAEGVDIFRVRIVPGRGAAELAGALSAHIDECEFARV